MCPSLFRRCRPVFVLALVVALNMLPAAVAADTGDFGWEGPSNTGVGGAATGEKPESKLWWNDGHWWAVMYSPAGAAHRIHRLNATTQQWTDTGVPIDTRAGSRADTLWHQATGKLYVASRGSGGGRLFRFSYNADTDTYTNDAGAGTANHLAQITATNPETMTIDRDTTGHLWASREAGGEVKVNRSTTDDATWGAEFTLPVTGATGLNSDDIASVVAFDGNKIGVMWSHQPDSRMYFSVHLDAGADTTWEVASVAYGSAGGDADDHINLKSLQADPNSDRVFAAIKTSRSNNPDPLVVLLRYDRSEGWWDAAVFGTEQDDHTRPIVMLDTTNRLVHLFATSPTSNSVGQTIYCKTTNMDAARNGMSFPAGLGEPVLRDASHTMNNATSAKQNVNSTTGLVVMAAGSAERYWHHHNALTTAGCNGVEDPGGEPPPNSAPVAADDSYSTPQDTTLNVAAPGVLANDTDADGDPLTATEVSDPGDDVTLNADGSFSYTPEPGFSGDYAFTYTANDGTDDSNIATVTITVTDGSGGGEPLIFTPTDDATVRGPAPNANYGNDTILRAFSDGNPDNNSDSYLKFSVAGLTDTVSSATLRLFVVQASPGGGDLYAAASNDWDEATITWNTRPGSSGAVLDSAGATTGGIWVELDVTSSIGADGTYSFVLVGTAKPATWYSSSEGSQPPQLVVTQGGT